MAKSASIRAEREGEKEEGEEERKKELRLFADGLAGHLETGEGGKIFPEERVEFRDLARSIMFAFSSRLAAFSHQKKNKSH